MDRALDRFPNKNRTVEFRIEARARSETNNYKSLWIALLIVFQNKNRTVEFRIQARARSETNNYKSLWIALLIGFHNKNRTFEFRIQARARSEANNFKSLWIALLIYFWKQINVLIPSLHLQLGRRKSYSNIFNSIFILELSKNRIQKCIFVFRIQNQSAIWNK